MLICLCSVTSCFFFPQGFKQIVAVAECRFKASNRGRNHRSTPVHTVKKIRKFRGPFTVDLLRIRSVLRNTESLLLRKAEFSPPARIFRRHYFQCGQCLPKFLQVTRKVGNRLVVWNENENGVPPCSPSYIKLVSIGSW